MKPSKLYRLEVAPLTILPLGKSPFFSYLADEPIESGTLVAISFGKQSLEGVVFGCAPLSGQEPPWIKHITKIIKKGFLTEKQLRLAQYVSQEYFTPLGNTLKHFLPKRVILKNKMPAAIHRTKTFRLDKYETELMRKLFTSKKEVPSYVNMYALNNSGQFFAQLAKKALSKREQLLILVPEIILLPSLQAFLEQYFPKEKISVLHSKRTNKAYFESWEKIRSGEATVVLATRQGLFAPFHMLGTILMLEEQDDSYKQWTMSPRYDGKRVATYLAALSDAHLILASGIPSIESLFHIEKNEYALLTPSITLPPQNTTLHIINLRLERFQKNYSPLSQVLITAIHEARNQGKQTLLYIHRQGMNAFSVCENCKNIFRCPKSGHTLSSTPDGAFRCSGCSYQTSSFPSCPQCGHLVFRHVGFGTERVEREIKKLFPGARIFRADGTTLKTEKTIQKFYTDASSGKIDILIGTQTILKSHSLPKLALIGMIDADSLLSFRDFRADERLFQILTRFVEQGKSNSNLLPKIMVQTFHPESTFFQKIQTLDSKAFSEKILEEREDLLYPPFTRFLTLSCRGKTKKTVIQSIQKLGINLKKLLPQQDSSYRITFPESATYIVAKKLFESTLLLRFPAKAPLPKTIRLFFEKIPSTCTIDVDPLSFS